eukprot:CAMPEP_0114437200 /NCGR_PEP_ID=MMETSP0103-20121206/13879_1 /TAXON_ID=37642 ORGANISM="Paraphysomonas imperforata, Strain PA2" /NCGR_SAMPLE_ID=MMETSP0103 /ASSEMBLY_ACC=CAM_ASM_000201 /LENGTH=297 /DNA_ID=CAMNT_0001607561 /DNA_START=44 /DNA_END=937 /DNA_ORIENTATION=-
MPEQPIFSLGEVVALGQRVNSVVESHFGYAVAMGDGTSRQNYPSPIAVVTSPGQGVADVYMMDPVGQWTHQDSLVGDDSASELFGQSVALSTSGVFIGDPHFKSFSVSSGGVSFHGEAVDILDDSSSAPSSLPSNIPSSTSPTCCPSLAPSITPSSLDPSDVPSTAPSASAAITTESHNESKYPFSVFFLTILGGSAVLMLFYVVVQQLLLTDLERNRNNLDDSHRDRDSASQVSHDDPDSIPSSDDHLCEQDERSVTNAVAINSLHISVNDIEREIRDECDEEDSSRILLLEMTGW